jgi:hypothetical protein
MTHVHRLNEADPAQETTHSMYDDLIERAAAARHEELMNTLRPISILAQAMLDRQSPPPKKPKPVVEETDEADQTD